MSEVVQLQNQKPLPPEEHQTPQWLRCLEAANPVTMAQNPAPDNAREVVEGRIGELEMWLVPVQPKAMAVLLKRLSNHYHMPPMTEAEREMFWADYRADIGQLPEDLLAGACDEWRRDPDNRFFPRPCELLDLASWRLKSRERRLRTLMSWLDRETA